MQSITYVQISEQNIPSIHKKSFSFMICPFLYMLFICSKLICINIKSVALWICTKLQWSDSTNIKEGMQLEEIDRFRTLLDSME